MAKLIKKGAGNRRTEATGRPKPLTHTPSLGRGKRRYGCGGKLSKKNS